MIYLMQLELYELCKFWIADFALFELYLLKESGLKFY